jgi:ElaB/YqjD/DUF883 family membrane-anchored ribosome-binding protein
MSDDIFKKWKEDWKKGMDKIQTDMKTGWDKLNQNTKAIFTPKEKDGKNDQPQEFELLQLSDRRIIPVEADLSSDSNESQAPNSPEPGKTNHTSEDIQNNLNEFKDSVNNTFKEWQNQWDSQFKKTRENNKRQSAEFKAKMEENNTKVKQFFEKSQTQMKENFEKFEQGIKAKNQENRRNFYQNLRTMQKNWNDFVLDQQKSLEKNMIQMNRKSIQTEIKVLIWALPFIFIILLFVFLFRPFFT